MGRGGEEREGRNEEGKREIEEGRKRQRGGEEGEEERGKQGGRVGP